MIMEDFYMMCLLMNIQIPDSLFDRRPWIQYIDTIFHKASFIYL